MTRLLRIGPVLVFALGVALFLAAAASPGTRGRVVDTSFRSRALGGTLHMDVYLPPGYATSGRRYPVVYFLHGLPAGATSYRGIGSLTKALEARNLKAILVAPEGARGGESDPEYLDHGPGRNWETALAVELPRVIDSRYRTIATRRGRALVGLSAGGYGAMLIALHHLGTYGAIESWSGYFHPTDPSGWHSLDLGSPAANAHASAHAAVPRLRAALARRPTFIGFYVGDADDRFLGENKQLHRELAAHRVPHVFHVYRGGHTQRLWSAHAEKWLELALDHLDRDG
jgi:enterochelin esterase-like enzyme